MTRPPLLHGDPDQARELASAAGRFEPISLEQLGSAALMDRIDTKFILPAGVVPELLRRCRPHYRALQVGGTRLSRYHTRYFDTPDLGLYRAHHDGVTPRYKVRTRTYVDSRASYLEVKLRSEEGRTRKARVPVSDHTVDAVQRLEREPMLGITQVVTPSDLEEAVQVDYTRLTLVGKEGPERLTLDSNLLFSRRGRTCSFPGLVVAEVKQDHLHHSHFLDTMREMEIEPGGLSKYCLGIASLEANAERRRFERLLSRLEQIGDGRLRPLEA